MVKGPHYGIDFRGGAIMYVLFNQKPPIDKIRSVLSAKIPGEISVVNVSGTNEVIIGTQIQEERSLEANRHLMVETLQAEFGTGGGKLDVNNSGANAVAERLRDPFQRAGSHFQRNNSRPSPGP
jgi:preprotein translocase subunit SecF